jgi:hypothetical protein
MHVRAVLLAAALLAVITPLHAQDESELTLDPALAAPRAPATGLPTSVRAAEELRAEETQRILGVVPEFNITDIHDAAPLSTGQKFQLALKSSVDPFTFVAAGLDALIDQSQKEVPGYGTGMQGYAKRFNAAYLDSLDGTLIGNALLPSLLHQDPRYFRQGTGSFNSRLMHAIASTWRCRDDNGKDTWNYSNVLGNIAAGGIANSYYPANERGAALTFQRAFTVTAEGTIGNVFFEFWPDVSRKLLTRKKRLQS